MPPIRLAPGTILSGRYQLAEIIGESDLSTVYSATDQRGQAQVALKVFDPTIKARAAALSEYQALARQASGLGVEGIARAYDFGIDANTGVPFSTAERISWPSLDRRVFAQGPLGVADLGRALSVLARALDAAHATQLVHRDLKPQNVFISPDNPEWARITDFGVGAVRRGAPEAMGWGGPPGYTPPDAVDAAAPGTPGADLFALGVVAFFALTRTTPFRSLRGPSFDANAHWSELNQSLAPISERAKEVGVALDPALDAWFARALALNPQERFRSAGEMARELATLSEQVSSRGGGGPRSMPGIAAAIAQPLVFQPEPSPASLGLAATSPITTAAMAAVAAAGAPVAAPTLVSPAEEVVAPPRKKSAALPLMIGLGVLLLSGLAVAGYAVLGKRNDATAAAPSASAAPSAVSTPAAVVVEPSTPSAEPTGPAKARFTCQPEACEWVVCDGKNVSGITEDVELTPGSHECSASRNGFSSKAVAFTAAAGQTSPVLFELAPLPAAQQAKAAAETPKPAAAAAAATPKAAAAATTAKPAASAKAAVATTAKPAASTPATKATATASAKPVASAKAPATAASVKAAAGTKAKANKKCSAFLGCK